MLMSTGVVKLKCSSYQRHTVCKGLARREKKSPEVRCIELNTTVLGKRISRQSRQKVRCAASHFNVQAAVDASVGSFRAVKLSANQ